MDQHGSGRTRSTRYTTTDSFSPPPRVETLPRNASAEPSSLGFGFARGPSVNAAAASARRRNMEIFRRPDFPVQQPRCAGAKGRVPVTHLHRKKRFIDSWCAGKRINPRDGNVPAFGMRREGWGERNGVGGRGRVAKRNRAYKPSGRYGTDHGATDKNLTGGWTTDVRVFRFQWSRRRMQWPKKMKKKIQIYDRMCTRTETQI